MSAVQQSVELREAMWRIADELNFGGLFATRGSIEDALAYVDTVANALSPADKVAMLTAVAVLSNTIRDQLRAAS